MSYETGEEVKNSPKTHSKRYQLESSRRRRPLQKSSNGEASGKVQVSNLKEKIDKSQKGSSNFPHPKSKTLRRIARQ